MAEEQAAFSSSQDAATPASASPNCYNKYYTYRNSLEPNSYARKLFNEALRWFRKQPYRDIAPAELVNEYYASGARAAAKAHEYAMV